MATVRKTPLLHGDISRQALRKVSGGRDGRLRWLEHLTPDISRWWDDFEGDTLHGGYQSSVNGSGSAAAAILAGQSNGAIRLNAGTADDGRCDLSLGLHYRGELNAVIAVRLQLTDITPVKVEVGFTDVVSGTDAGAVATKATPTFNATDCALWAIDTDDTTTWEGLAANNGTTSPATTVEAAITPTAGEYETLMVELRKYDTDSALDGTEDAQNLSAVRYSRYDQYGERTFRSDWQTNGPNSNVDLTPWVFAQNRSGSPELDVDIDYIHVWQRRSRSEFWIDG